MKKRPGFLWLIVATLLMSCFGAVNALAWPVPDTGQTICYDADGNVLDPCPSSSDAFYGQDASYTINPISYTKLDANGTALSDGAGTWAMVRDNVTGLIWEVKQAKNGTPNYTNPHDADNTYTWYDSNPLTNGGDAGTPGAGTPGAGTPGAGTPGAGTDTEDFINALNAANYGGYHDWRMPTIKELASIIDYSIPFSGPCINAAYFPNTQASNYWSSTTYVDYTVSAWTMSFYYGFGDRIAKDGGGFVRAVRGGQARPLGHLVINGDGTVTDTDTGLMWQQNVPDNTMAWESALSNCETSDVAGYEDWRLPTFRDLRSLVDYSRFDPAINTTYFPDTAASNYWSSTTNADYTEDAWYMDFYDGYDGNDSKSSDYYVRAVRGGQAESLGHLVISAPKQASAWAIGALMPIRWSTADLGANVKISLSRQGGKAGTFETIIASTSNDGQYDWTVTGPGSVNCVIKIEQADNASNWATEGLFVINAPVNPAIYLLLLE